MAGSLTQDKIKNVFHKLVFLDNEQLYTTEAGGANDVALPGFKLGDEIGVTYGTDNDFKMFYSNAFDSFMLKSTGTVTGNTFITVKNENTTIFGINPDGVVNLSTVTSADAPVSKGDMKFASNDLYIAKD
tara:strand:- start:722 stop:1111 length:390 start_codon:yes stop_codon:yes gene_type:complete